MIGRHRRTMIARRRFTAEYDGERVVVAKGERIDDDHPIVRRYPDEFTSGGQRAAAVRSASRGDRPRRRMTAAQQGRIRRARLDELAARERERPESPDAETLFWQGVDRLLGFDRLKSQAEDDERFLDRLEAAKARDIRAGVEDLSEWLAR